MTITSLLFLSLVTLFSEERKNKERKQRREKNGDRKKE